MADSNALPMVLLAEQFAKLPGIGMKSAQRLAYYLISRPEEEVQAFADAMVHAKKAIHYCSCCQNLTDQAVCPICSDDTRDHGIICVVEAPKDVAAFERTNEYHGVYHVLHGLISPLTGVMPGTAEDSGTVGTVTERNGSRSHYGNESHCGGRCHSDVSRTAAQADADKSFPFGIWIASRRCGGICR